MNHEEETIRSFIPRRKRERYLGFVSNPRTRTKFTHALAHFRDIDASCKRLIIPSKQNPKEIERILVAKGSPGFGYLISEDSNLDGKELQLREALEEIVGRGMGTILSCIPGCLAFMETEDERFILERLKQPKRGSLYVRFVTPQIDEDSRVKEGIFVAAYRLRESGELSKYEYDELTDDLEWFEQHLPIPPPLSHSSSGTAVSWFKSGSKDFISRVWSMVRILEDNGVVIKKITGKRPSWIIYEDECQIVARPLR